MKIRKNKMLNRVKVKKKKTYIFCNSLSSHRVLKLNFLLNKPSHYVHDFPSLTTEARPKCEVCLLYGVFTLKLYFHFLFFYKLYTLRHNKHKIKTCRMK